MTKQTRPRPDVSAPEGIRETALGFQQSRVLLTAYELGVFNALGDRPKTAGQVSRACRTDKAATRRLMNALTACGFLKKRGDRFANTPAARRFLVRSSKHFMAGLMHVAHMWDTWSSLSEAVRRGRAAGPVRPDRRGASWLEVFIAAMHERARSQAPRVASLLDLRGVRNVLDVGGGSGAYAMAFAGAGEDIQAVVFDLPATLMLTRQYVRQAGLSSRIKTAPGDFTRDELGEGFDLVFLSAVIHSNSAGENRALLRRCARSCRTGGQVVVQDFIMDPDRTRPLFGALFSLNMLVATRAGDTYTESEVRGWMRQAGLSNLRRIDTGFGTALIIGRKIENVSSSQRRDRW